MTSVSLRKSTIPKDIILLKDDCTIPSGFSSISSYDGKYLKNVPNICTNPGTIGGSISHTHSSQSAHSHTPTVSSTHNHGGSYTVGGAGQATHIDSICSTPAAKDSHNHSGSVGSQSPGFTVSSDGSHTHDVQNNDPSFVGYKLIKKSNLISIRKSAPFNSLSFWSENLSLIPSRFSLDCSVFGKLVKITSPPTSGGRSTHIHSSEAHTHTVSINSHSSHIIGSLGNPNMNTCPTGTPKDISSASTTHSHSYSPTQGSGTDSQFSDSQGHTHDSLSLIPSSKKIAVIKQTQISLRKQSIEPSALVLWEDIISNIPSGYQVADGTNGTLDYTGKHLIGVDDACTNPGSDIGLNSHEHSSDSHSHANVSLCHTHTLCGSVGSTSDLTIRNLTTRSFADPIIGNHSHGAPSSLPNQNHSVDLPTNGAHTHGFLSLEPPNKTIAFIQRL